jgi:ATP-binding cassette, subfamily B, multidrug efflux pump
MAPLRKLLLYAARHKIMLVSGLLCLLAANLLKVISPMIVQQSVDSLNGQFTSSLLLLYSGAIAAIALIQGGFAFAQERLILGIARYIERDIKHDFYAHLQKLTLAFFHQNRTGELMARCTNDISSGVIATTSAFMYSINNMVALIVILPLMARLSWRLTALAFTPLLLVIIATLLLQKRMRSRFEKVQECFGRISARAQEALWAVRSIRAYTQEKAQIESFREVSRQYIRLNLRHTQLSGALYPLLQFLIGLSYIAVLWYGGDLISRKSFSFGQFLEFLLYLGYLAWPMYVLGWEMSVIQKGVVSMGRIEHILSLQPGIQDAAVPAKIQEIQGAIEFRNVSFKYQRADRPALKEISFRIEPGQMVGLVGAIGSGKSTLLNMIPRFLEPCSGEILIDGQPLHLIPLKMLRRFMGYVPQETFLFSDTIAANIAFGNEAASAEEVERVAMNCGIAADISTFSSGYQTLVGERGATLSGGQKQRISIARAVLSHPAVLLLDDAFSSIDSHTEKDIFNRLRKVMRGKTCLISSHRISTLKDADLIIVLQHGRIVEYGSHDELLASGRVYAEMYLTQLLEEDVAATSQPAALAKCIEDGPYAKALSEPFSPKP